MLRLTILVRNALATVTRALAPAWVGRGLLAIALVSGTIAVALSAAVHFGLLQPQNQETQSAAVETTTTDPAMSQYDDEYDASGDLADDDQDEDGTEDADDDGSYEIPDSLRSEAVSSALNDPALKQLNLLDSLIPGASETMGAAVFDREQVLDDVDQRIDESFRIPDGMRDRVGFWFDVYTKYDSNRRIIHHARYPWIIYKVIDVSFIINSDQPRRLWMRREKADAFVKAEEQKIRGALKKLAARKQKGEPDEYQILVAKALEPLGGDLRKQAVKAARDVRVQTGQKDFFIEGLSLSSRYLGTMEKIFERHKLPVELTRIPFVESSFNKHATSKVGASGIWQFMDGTGRKFMHVDDEIDERRSPFKATEAAARLLKENHLILHRSWPLAVTAWNHGPGGIRKAIAGAGSRDLAKIVASYRSRSFDFASMNFYSEFLAALHAERYSGDLFGDFPHAPHVDLQVVALARSVRYSDLVRVSGMSEEDFLLINPELTTVAKKNLRLPKGFRLSIPETAVEGLDKLFAANARELTPAGGGKTASAPNG